MACDDRPVCIFAFYLQILGDGIFILYPVLNVQLTPVVTANRHFMLPRFPCGAIRNIRLACFVFFIMMGVESQRELMLLC